MSKFELIAIDKLTMVQPSNQWLINGFIEASTLGMVFGQPESGKSLLLMEMAFNIATGTNWCGHPTNQGDVIYIAGEGFNGISKRFEGLKKKYEINTSSLLVSSREANLMEEDSIEEIYTEIQNSSSNPVLIIIDTLHRNFGSGDENNSNHINKLVRNLTALIKVTKATVILAHHTGHGNASRGRGSSSIKASLDFEYQVTNKNGVLKFECSKSKDFKKPTALEFKVMPIHLPHWVDSDGNPLETATLDLQGIPTGNGNQSLNYRSELALEELKKVINIQGITATTICSESRPDLTNNKWVLDKPWRSAMYLTAEFSKLTKESKRQAYKRAVDNLISLNLIVEKNGMFTLTK